MKKEKKAKKPFYKRVWFIIVAIVLLAVGGTAMSMLFSYEVTALVLRIGCTDNKPIKPDNYAEILQGTEKLAENVSYESAYENGILDVIAPTGNSEKLPLFVYIHGGYYVGGDKNSKEPYCRIIANDGYVVANINYALVPSVHYPVPLIQANEAISFLVKNADEYNIDTGKIFIAGDSAGSHLTSVLGAFYTNDELQQKTGIVRAIEKEQLAGVALMCGMFNISTVRESKFPFLNSAMWMLTDVKKYENYDRIDELNTVDNVTPDYPATYILCGDKDPFLEQNKEMIATLSENGISTTQYLPTSTDKKLNHEFQCDFKLPEAQTAMTMLLEFLAENSGRA